MKKLILYGINGIINTLLGYMLFLFLASLIDYRAAVVISYACGMISSYLLNSAIVFDARGHLPLFISVNLCLMLVNLSVTWFLVEGFDWPKEIAQAAAIIAVFGLGFFLNKSFVFSRDFKTNLNSSRSNSRTF